MPALTTLAAELDQTLGWIEAALPDEPLDYPQPASTPALPDLRASYMRLLRKTELKRNDALLARELDELVDAVNSLRVLATSASAPSRLSVAAHHL